MLSIDRKVALFSAAVLTMAGCGTIQRLEGPNKTPVVASTATTKLPQPTFGPARPESTPATAQQYGIKTDCFFVDATLSTPPGWYVSQRPLGQGGEACLVTEQPSNTLGRPYVTGIEIRKIPVASGVSSVDFAKQLMSKPDPDRNPVSGSIREQQIRPPFTAFVTGEFRNLGDPTLGKEVAKAVVIGDKAYIATFRAPLPLFPQTFSRLSAVFDGITIQGHSTKP